MRMNGHAGIDDAILPREPSLDQAIVGEMTALDAAERAYAMAAARGDWTATNHAGRVMAGAAARLDRLENRRRCEAVAEAEARADEVRQACEAMIGNWLDGRPKRP